MSMDIGGTTMTKQHLAEYILGKIIASCNHKRKNNNAASKRKSFFFLQDDFHHRMSDDWWLMQLTLDQWKQLASNKISSHQK